jgi:hypothetical protein
MLEHMQQRVNGNTWLVQRGRYVNTTFQLEATPHAWLITIHHGRVESISSGPFVMPRWTFALRATFDTWKQFWQPAPAPGYHDLLAMLRYRRLAIEGDPHPFMSNLLYFKEVLASPRDATA